MKTLLTIFAVAFMLLPLKAQLSVGESAFLLGRQQVIAQQIARSYMAIELKMEVQTYKLLLTDGINLYHRNLKQIEEIKANDKVAKSIAEMTEAWDDFYFELKNAPQGEEVLDLIKQSRTLLDKTDLVINELEAFALEKEQINPTAMKMLKLAERQNAISQHAVLYYLAHWHEVPVGKFFTDFHGLITEYENNTYALIEATEELPEIKSQIMKAAYDWREVEKVITKLNEEPRKDELRKVLDAASQLYRDANEVAKEYKKMVDVAQSADTIN